MSVGTSYQSLSELVVRRLRERILNGDLPAGMRLVEQQLSEEMDVSRMPVREALQQLAAEGLVKLERRRGASVATLTEEKVYDMIEVRALLEGVNAQLAALRRGPADVARLQKILQSGTNASKARRKDRCREVNRSVHAAVAEITDNSVLSELMISIRHKTALAFRPDRKERDYESWEEHARILKAVIDSDPTTAAHAAITHVIHVGRSYIGDDNFSSFDVEELLSRRGDAFLLGLKGSNITTSQDRPTATEDLDSLLSD